MREQNICSFYLATTGIVKFLSHLVLFFMMCGRLITPQLLCLTSTERCCISTVLAPQKSLLSECWSKATRAMSLCLWVMQHHKPGGSTATATTAVPTCHPAQEGKQVLNLLQEVHSLSRMHSRDTLGGWVGWETGCAQSCSSDCTSGNSGVGTEMQNQRAWKCSCGVVSQKSKEMWWFTLGFAAVCAKTTSRILINLFRCSYLLKCFGSFCSETKRFNSTKRTEIPQTKYT